MKLKTYRVLEEESTMTSQSLPQLQTSPSTATCPPKVVQHLERIADDTDSGPSLPEPKSRPQSGVKKGMSGSTSMDSLLSLSDLDSGMEIQTSPKRSTNVETAESNHVRQKVCIGVLSIGEGLIVTVLIKHGCFGFE